MANPTIKSILEAAARILVIHERCISVSFRDDQVQIKFPTTRSLATHLGIPHYYVIPCFATMEEERLVTRTERVGIFTTTKGSRELMRIIASCHREEAEKLLGKEIFGTLLDRIAELETEDDPQKTCTDDALKVRQT